MHAISKTYNPDGACLLGGKDKYLNIIHVNLIIKGLTVVAISLQGFWSLVSR
jgi:hypothetical protein